jgi:steroid delta-isomerase-like uncharacterized protein
LGAWCRDARGPKRERASERRPSRMSVEANKEVVSRALDTKWNKKDWSSGQGLAAPDPLVHAPHRPEPYVGEEAFAELGKMVQSAFPDYHLTIDEMIGEGDKVVVLFTWTGTNTGELMGLPPTGKKVEMHEVNIYRMTPDHKVAEIWANQDMGSMMQQLGLAPAGPPPRALIMFMRVGQRLGRLVPRRKRAKAPDA